MINLEKSISNILKEKYIFKDILIIGGGNWAKLYLEVLLNTFFKVKKIFIYSKHNKKKILIFLKKYKKNNVKLIANINKIKTYSKNVVIVNKGYNRLKLIDLFSSKKFRMLIEKPIVDNLHEYELIEQMFKEKKINFLVGFQRYYAVYFHHFKKKYVKNLPKKINFSWFDGKYKITDKDKYIENILYHIFSILFIFLNKRKIKIIKRGKNFLKINYGNTEVNVSFLRKLEKKHKKIDFYFKNKSKKSINWTNESRVYYIINKKIKLYKPEFSIHNLQYQLFYFLSVSNKNFKKLPNNISNFKYFFKIIKDINNNSTIKDKINVK